MKRPMPRVMACLLGLTMLASAVSAAPDDKVKAADQAHARRELAGLFQLPAFSAPGPVFDARGAMANKSILSIPGPTNIPFYAHVLIGMKEASEAVGYPFSVWINQGLESEHKQGIVSALATKPALVDLLSGPDPTRLKPEINAVKKAGIPVVSSHGYGVGIRAPHVSYTLTLDYQRAGRLLADWVITKDLHAHVLVLISDDVAATAAMRTGIVNEFGRYGGSNVQYTFVNVPLNGWEGGIPPAVAAAVAGDTQLTYIIGIYDGMAKFIVAALEKNHADSRIKVIGFNGTPDAIDLVRAGKVEMVLGEGLEWAGYAIADAEMRILAGSGRVQSLKVPFRVFTQTNAAEAGVPATFDQGYGDDFKHQFARLWQLPEASPPR